MKKGGGGGGGGEEGDYCSHGTPINWAFNMIHTLKNKKNDMGCPPCCLLFFLK